MNVDGVLAHLPTQLTNGFHERRTLNVTDGTANLSDDEVVMIFLTEQFHVALDFIGDMRNHLNGLTQVITATFLVDDGFVDSTRRKGVRLCCLNTRKPFIMT